MWFQSPECCTADLNQEPLGAAGREDSHPSVPSATAPPSLYRQQPNSHSEKLKYDGSGYFKEACLKLNKRDLELKKNEISQHLYMDHVNKESLNSMKVAECFTAWSCGVQPKCPHIPKKVLTLLAERAFRYSKHNMVHQHGSPHAPRGPTIRPNAAASCQQVLWSCWQTSPSEVTISPSNAHNQSHPLQ